MRNSNFSFQMFVVSEKYRLKIRSSSCMTTFFQVAIIIWNKMGRIRCGDGRIDYLHKWGDQIVVYEEKYQISLDVILKLWWWRFLLKRGIFYHRRWLPRLRSDWWIVILQSLKSVEYGLDISSIFRAWIENSNCQTFFYYKIFKS